MTLRAIGTIVLVPCALALLGSGCDTRVAQPAPRAPAQPAAVPGAGAAGWVLVHHEDFEDLAVLGTPPPWARDTHPDDGPFSDQSTYFAARGIAPPVAYRRSQRFGEDGWLTIESYSRSPDTSFADQTAVVADPGNGRNHVLRLRSREHTDATVVRPTRALPARYRISLRVGHADFGDGLLHVRRSTRQLLRGSGALRRHPPRGLARVAATAITLPW